MPLVRIGAKHQITIPKAVFDALHLEEGDYLEITAQNGKGVFVPKKAQFVEKAPAPKLSRSQQKTLAAARKKIEAIQQDLKNSKGLTNAEADVAAKVGLIDPDQIYWWLESWQKGEREAEREGSASGKPPTFTNSEDAVAFLKRHSK